VNPVALNARNPGPMTGGGNWTWLLRGRLPTLIDAGTGQPRHIDSISEALKGVPLAQVLVTHSHSDHASGAPAIAERMPGVRFFKMPWPERDVRWPAPWEPLADGDVVEAGDTSLTVLHTPGHAPDHLCFWHEESRVLFGGDLAIKGTTVYIPAAYHGDLAAYLASIERVIALQPVRLLPAHGAVLDAPVTVLRRYLVHRREREEQILDLVRRGTTTVDAIAADLYRGLSDALLIRAREMVGAHLIKLEREGRVSRRGDAWNMIEK
jgi:glyoxylase-like metal-dependent hydrolase (beta-lactamase superfamily II)